MDGHDLRSTTDALRHRPNSPEFAKAFGQARGPSRNDLFRELALAQERLARQNERIAELEPRLEREVKARAIADRSVARLRKAQVRARRNDHLSAYRLQMVCYAALYRLPGEALPTWAASWSSIDGGVLQGDFSPRRPYLPGQVVRDGTHGLFTCRRPVAPARVRPHSDHQRWNMVAEYQRPSSPSRADVPADAWRFDWAIPGQLDRYTDEDLWTAIADARALARTEWAMEIREARLLYPCPASAYLTASQWLADMPGFRSAMNTLGRRTRRQKRASTPARRTA